MKLKKNLKNYNPHIITKIICFFTAESNFINKTNNELLYSYNNLMEENIDDLLEQNINYAYYLKKFLIKKQVIKNENS